jgi:hypothetical protein
VNKSDDYGGIGKNEFLNSGMFSMKFVRLFDSMSNFFRGIVEKGPGEFSPNYRRYSVILSELFFAHFLGHTV